MAQDPNSGQNYALARLILDYGRSLAWPALLGLLIAFFWSDLSTLKSKLLSSAEFELEVFGIKVRSKAASIDEIARVRLQEIIDELRKDALSVQQRKDLAAELDAVSRGLQSELKSLRDSSQRETARTEFQVNQERVEALQALRASSFRRTDVERLERLGFEATLRGDVTVAIEHFQAAYKLWPDYHNVDEIRKLLIGRKENLSEPANAAWQSVYAKILKDYSWGLPKDLREEFRSRTR